MAGKGRFKVPTGQQMEESDTSIKTKSLFDSYRRNKGTSADGSDQTSKTSTAPAKVSVSSAQQSKPVIKETVPARQTSIGNTTTPSIIQHKDDGSQLSLSTITQQKASVSNGQVNSIPGPGTAKAASVNSIIVNYRQRGNPILKHIRNVTWEYGSIIPDYVMGKANCALFLSLRYHQLNPEYLHNRLKELGKGYDLRVLLVQVDIKEPHHLLKDLAKICILADCTLMLAFSAEEAGKYLESYKVYENKPAEALMEKTDSDFVSQVTDCLTTVKSVNKTDCLTLLSTFKSMEGIINSNKEDLSLCTGFGPQKAQRLYNVFHEPFLNAKKQATALETEASSSCSPAKKPR